MSDRASGWQPDPTGRHQWRQYVDGWPTDVVRDGDAVGEDRFVLSASEWQPGGSAPVYGAAAQPFQPGYGQPYQPPGPWSPPGSWSPQPTWARAGYGDPQAPWSGYAPAGPFYPAPDVRAPARRRWIWIGVSAGLAVVVVATLIAVIGSRGSSPTAASDYPAGGGVLITDTDAHFSARFPAQPSQVTAPAISVGADSIVLRLATVRRPHYVAVEEAETTVPMSTSEYAAQLRGAIGGFEGSSGMTLISQQATTFQGHVARTAQMSSPTTRYTVLFFVYDANRFYGLVAPSGATFTTLSESFLTLS